jgi:hypothetical protein
LRPRTEAVIGMLALIGVGVIAAVVGRSRAGAVTAEQGSQSTFLSDPSGASALLAAAQRLGIEVRRFRQRSVALADLTIRPRTLLVVLGPDAPLSPADVEQIRRFGGRAALLLAGPAAEPAMRCYGYQVERRLFDSARVGLGLHPAWAVGTLKRRTDSVVRDSSRAADAIRTACTVPLYLRVDTLLTSARGPVALRLVRSHAPPILLVSDARLFDNKSLRDSDAGPFALGLIAGQFDEVVFEEYHHGYGDAGSLAATTLAWSWRSPWGWAVWQLAAVGVVALLAGGIRFGPAVPVIVRRRRSPLEHVEALAIALSAAHGHDQAISALVRGLRRRLAPPALRSRGDWRVWLQQLDQHAASPEQRRARQQLTQFSVAGQPSSSVLLAANLVEDLWDQWHR